MLVLLTLIPFVFCNTETPSIINNDSVTFTPEKNISHHVNVIIKVPDSELTTSDIVAIIIISIIVCVVLIFIIIMSIVLCVNGADGSIGDSDMFLMTMMMNNVVFASNI